jgi:hypothetical protein
MVSDIEGNELSMTGEGTFSADATRGHMTFELDADENQGSFEAIADGRETYLKGDQLPLPAGKEWLKTTDAPSRPRTTAARSTCASSPRRRARSSCGA